MSIREFSKYEGLGNDFVVVEAATSDAVTSAEAARVCDRRFGVGADGVLLVLPGRTPGAVARMRVINADGSIPEMCGNGLRCVAVHVARARGLDRGELLVDTDAGPRACVVDGPRVRVDMGIVRVSGARELSLAGEGLSVVVADAGNPHAVALGEFSREDVARLGPQVATHASFPQGTNAEFARLTGPRSIDLAVWERGVGLTLACGTGACATAAVACALGLAPRGVPLAVTLPGGPLEITIDDDGRALMRGPARRVFSGVLG